MSKKDKRVLNMIISFLIFPYGIFLYFTAKPKNDAQLFLIIAIIGFFVVGFSVLRFILNIF